MIDEVIICGLRRAKERVEIGEIKQAIGRAGRSYSKSGKAVIVCSSSDVKYAEQCFYDETPPVKSELNSVGNVAFHVLPWIDRVYDEETFQKWYGRSLASTQGYKANWSDVSRYLIEHECINEEYELTDFGRISVRMYYHPERIFSMKERLVEANANGNANDFITLSYVFASEHIPLSNVEPWELSEYKSSLGGNGYVFEHGELLQGFAYYCAMKGGMIPKWIRHIVSQIRDDLPRLFNTLVMIAEFENLTGLIKDLRITGISAIRKVSREMAETMFDFNLSNKNIAQELNDFNVYHKEDLNKVEEDVIKNGSDMLLSELEKSGFMKDFNHRKFAGN